MPAIRRKRKAGESGVGATIRHLRNERGWTLQQLAGRCGFGLVYLCDLELGRRPCSPLTAYRVARALDTEPAPLVQEVLEYLIASTDLEVVVRKKLLGVP